MNKVSGLCSLQQSLEIGSYVKMLVREVLSDRYRIREEKRVFIAGIYRLQRVC